MGGSLATGRYGRDRGGWRDGMGPKKLKGTDERFKTAKGVGTRLSQDTMLEHRLPKESVSCLGVNPKPNTPWDWQICMGRLT